MTRVRLAAHVALVLLLPFTAYAFNATSTSFYLRGSLDSISGGNATSSVSTSTSFQMLGAGGQTVHGTTTSSTTFSIYTGILKSLHRYVRPQYTTAQAHWRNDDGSESAATSAAGAGSIAWASYVFSSTTESVGVPISVTSPSFTPPNDSLLVATVGLVNELHDVRDLTTVSGGGLTWTKRATALGGNFVGYYDDADIWTAPVSTGASMQITVANSATSGTDPAVVVMQVTAFTGYDVLDPVGAVGTSTLPTDGQGTTTLAASPSLTSGILGAVYSLDSATVNTTVTPGTGWTELNDNMAGNGYGNLQVQVRTNTTSDKVVWNDVKDNASANFADIHGLAIEINADTSNTHVITGVAKNTTYRLRIEVSNEGGTQTAYNTEQFRLEYGEKVSTCSAISSWTDVGTGGGGHWDMSDSTFLTNGDPTTNISTTIGGVSDENKYFIGAGGVLDTSSQSSAISVPSHSFIELEYSIKALSAATDSGTYCFRVTDAGSSTNYVYTLYPEATLAAGAGSRPVASAAAIDSGATSVTLTENTTKNVVCAGTVTDNDGYTDISSVLAYLYRTSQGTTTGNDDNYKYLQVGDSQCVPSSGAGLSETYTCTFPVQYYADPTDAGSPQSSDNWTCEMWPSDSVATGTVSVDTIEVSSLLALDVTATIPYGSVSANTDTGATNQTTTVTNTGNRDMDPQLSGTNMTDGGNTIAVAQQKYADASFTYSSGGTALSTTPTAINITLPQRTSGAITDVVLWGLGVPNGTVSGSYTGTNTFTAAAGI